MIKVGNAAVMDAICKAVPLSFEVLMAERLRLERGG